LHQQKGMISLSPPTICNSAGSCAAPSAKGDDKFITTDYLQQCPKSDSVQDALFMKLVEIHFQRSMQSWPKRRLKPTFVIHADRICPRLQSRWLAVSRPAARRLARRRCRTGQYL
ncbi:TPA: hypothetical protein JD248_18555, partial [Proteus mirabilis]|nr:hypothetical protein [Proteus mirabilis]